MTTLVENYVEKRRHGRARAGLPVIYHYESPSARNRRVENVARTINVSAGGLCMTVRDDITRETPLHLKLQVRNRAIKCTGRVVRDGEREIAAQPREIAVELDLSPDDREFLAGFLGSQPAV